MDALRRGMRWLAVIGGLLPVALFPAQVMADGFTITRAETTLEGSVFRMSATIDYDLSAVALDALENGVPLTFVLEINVVRQRAWLWDEAVATLEQRYQLQYHALTKNYLVRNLNSGFQQSLPTLDAALSSLGTIVDLPVLDKELLQPGEQYLINLRAVLDIEELPVPMRVLAYFTADWRLGSEWYSWPLPF